jgi:hypothetical protein
LSNLVDTLRRRQRAMCKLQLTALFWNRYWNQFWIVSLYRRYISTSATWLQYLRAACSTLCLVTVKHFCVHTAYVVLIDNLKRLQNISSTRRATLNK